VGGILRDISPWAPRPIALLNALLLAPIDDPRNVGPDARLVARHRHTTAIAWRNPPWAEKCLAIPATAANPLVNANGPGLMETEKIVCSGRRVGNPVVYGGQHHGRDGNGGGQPFAPRPELSCRSRRRRTRRAGG